MDLHKISNADCVCLPAEWCAAYTVTWTPGLNVNWTRFWFKALSNISESCWNTEIKVGIKFWCYFQYFQMFTSFSKCQVVKHFHVYPRQRQQNLKESFIFSCKFSLKTQRRCLLTHPTNIYLECLTVTAAVSQRHINLPVSWDQQRHFWGLPKPFSSDL